MTNIMVIMVFLTCRQHQVLQCAAEHRHSPCIQVFLQFGDAVFPVATTTRVVHYPVVISFWKYAAEIPLLMPLRWIQIKAAQFHLIRFPGILWHLARPLLATPESPADSFSFMCAHLPRPSVVAMNPIRELRRPATSDAIGRLAQVTFAVQRRRLSCLQILTCGGRKKKIVFSQLQIWKGNICWSGLWTREIWIRGEKMCLTF